ncbi:MAG TPA: carboxypeptidase-like regulatory domain-containing protein, partial [Gemmatimonadaceae bacterium]|nr:carboxypeptidase-like regulatory domain-containing protein [Gemmatimonadaceae bacterium]
MSPPAPRRSRARVRRRTAVASAVALAGLLGRGRIEAQEPTPTVVRGVVFDSTSMRPLAGARVQLVSLPVVGGPRTVGTDSAGAFRFDSLAVGAYLVGFSHPRLDSVGFEPSLVRVNLRTPGTVTALLAVPSSRSLVRASCRIDPRVDSTGIYLGYVRSAVDGLPVPQASLRLEWPEFLLGRSGLERVTRAIDARANGSGGFLICGVPAATTVLVH